MNLYILYKLIQQLKRTMARAPGEEEQHKIQGGGVLFQLLKKVFKIVDK